MKKKKVELSILLLGLGFTALGQESPVASGGNGTGSGGSASYSVGQVVFTTHQGAGGSASQGVQQPYEISQTTGVVDKNIALQSFTYPNPTTDVLTLQMSNQVKGDISYQLLDQNGKLIESKKVASEITNIQMSHLAAASYFLKITNNNKEVKTFKIIKN